MIVKSIICKLYILQAPSYSCLHKLGMFFKSLVPSKLERIKRKSDIRISFQPRSWERGQFLSFLSIFDLFPPINAWKLNLTILNAVLISDDLILVVIFTFFVIHFEYSFRFLFAKGKCLNNGLLHSC